MHESHDPNSLTNRRVIVIGSSSPLGERITALALAAGAVVVATSRSVQEGKIDHKNLSSICLNLTHPMAIDSLELRSGDLLVNAAPLRILAKALIGRTLPTGVAVTVLSSASATTKALSIFPKDAEWAREVLVAEQIIKQSAQNNVRILRPTMIYGSGRDRNIVRLAKLLGRVHILPLVGGGRGLRAPVHVDDLAQVVMRVSMGAPLSNPMHVPGGERVTYHDMVKRVARAADIRYVTVPVPALPFQIMGKLFTRVGRVGWLFAVCARMTEDLTVPDDARILGVERRSFHPDALAVGCLKDLR